MTLELMLRTNQLSHFLNETESWERMSFRNVQPKGRHLRRWHYRLQRRLLPREIWTGCSC
jgi:hypothetical protein